MGYCVNCGTAIIGKYCANCGTPARNSDEAEYLLLSRARKRFIKTLYETSGNVDDLKLYTKAWDIAEVFISTANNYGAFIRSQCPRGTAVMVENEAKIIALKLVELRKERIDSGELSFRKD